MKPTILWVDDVALIHTQTRLRREGYEISPFSNGLDALVEVKGGLDYQLAFVDLSLPDIDGAKVVSELKRMHPKKPVITASAYDWKAEGADGSIRKPFYPSELIKIIEEYLSPKPSENS